MKKLLSVLLAVAMIASCAALCAQGEAYPESAHPYADGADETWTYTHPGSPTAIFVTFSAQTFVEPGTIRFSLPEAYSPQELEAFALTGQTGREGDRIELYDSRGNLVRTYTGDALAGQTIAVPGESVTIRLVSDDSETGYGFAVEQITDALPDGFAKVNYHLPDACLGDVVSAGDTITLHTAYAMRQTGNEMIVGWKTAQGKVYSYENVKDDWTGRTKTDLTAESGAVYDLYPVTCPISMTSDDVYSFLNSSSVFNADLNGYLYKTAHFRRVITGNIAAFGLSPFMPVAAVILTYYALYGPTVDFTGSCTGIAMTELLQHTGKLDLLSRQGVGTVRELQPDEELQSIINFYAVQAIPAHLTCHMGIDPGSKDYSAQLRALYDTLCAGKPVYFEFYLDEQHPMKTIFKPGSGEISIGHSIVLTGAYTDANGNHILIAADCCYPDYAEGTCTTLFIDPDFTDLYYPTWLGGEPLDGFSWTEDFSQYDALSIEGTPNPLAWHTAFLRNLGSLTRQNFGLYFKR